MLSRGGTLVSRGVICLLFPGRYPIIHGSYLPAIPGSYLVIHETCMHVIPGWYSVIPGVIGLLSPGS